MRCCAVLSITLWCVFYFIYFLVVVTTFVVVPLKCEPVTFASCIYPILNTHSVCCVWNKTWKIFRYIWGSISRENKNKNMVVTAYGRWTAKAISAVFFFVDILIPVFAFHSLLFSQFMFTFSFLRNWRVNTHASIWNALA